MDKNDFSTCAKSKEAKVKPHEDSDEVLNESMNYQQEHDINDIVDTIKLDIGSDIKCNKYQENSKINK